MLGFDIPDWASLVAFDVALAACDTPCAAAGVKAS